MNLTPEATSTSESDQIASDQIAANLTEVAEKIEAEFMYRYVTGTPDPARREAGVATTRLGGGAVLSMATEPSRYWSKVVGVGFDEPVTSDLLDQVFAFYRANNDPSAVLQLAPSVIPEDWPELCARYGLRAGPTMYKLACPIDAFTPGRTDLRIDAVRPEHAREWASVMLTNFGFPLNGVVDMIAASIADEATHPLAAWDGDRIVGTADLLIHGRVGGLICGSTLASHRRRGVHSGLFAARMEMAAAAGCRWLVSETGTGNLPSLGTMQRAGLKILYTRQNWLWEA